MADKWVATSMIRYLPDDAKDRSELQVFEPGDEVTGVPAKYMDRLKETGSVAKQSDLEKREAPEGASDLEKRFQAALKDKDDEIAELRAKLAEAEKRQNAPATTSTSTGTTAAKK